MAEPVEPKTQEDTPVKHPPRWRRLRARLPQLLLAAVALLCLAGAGAVLNRPGAIDRLSRALAWTTPRPADVSGITAVGIGTITRLEAQIRKIEEDRDRLAVRIGILEQELAGQTGSTRPGQGLREIPAPAPPPAPAPKPAAAEAPGPVPPGKVRFGIELGSGASLASLSQRWTNLTAAETAALGGLQPLVAVRESAQKGVELRLLAGPFESAAAAQQVCATLAPRVPECQPAVYDGQRLTGQ